MPTRPPNPPTRSSSPPACPDEAIRRARKLAEASEKDVEKASKACLKRCLTLPLQKRLKALDYVALIDRDRQLLRRSFGDTLGLQKPRKWSASGPHSLVRALGRSRHHAWLVAKVTMVTIFIGAPALTAWRNTASAIEVNSPRVLHWEAPGHMPEPSSIEAGSPIVVVHRFGIGFFARKWSSAIGYVYAPIHNIGGLK